MRTLIISFLLGLCSLSAGDWKTYQGDFARSGFSEETLTLPLEPAWSFQTKHPPRPAWQGEAKWDGWNKVYDMKARQIFDRAFHVVVADGRLFFGSSADDKIYCLDAETGRLLWSFFTEGPVRFAPTLSEGKLFVGSDDGAVYCLETSSGSLVWQHRPGPRDQRIPGNGRIISAWPVRTGLVVMEGILYGSAGMFPSEGVYLFGLDALTGEERWKVVHNDLPAQGYMLASESRLYVPAGRNNPVVYDRSNGNRLKVLDGSGGTYALLTGDSLIFGPGKTGQLGWVDPEEKDQMATFAGNHMIVRPEMSYLQSDTELTALDRSRYLALSRERRDLSREQSGLKKRLDALEKNANSDPLEITSTKSRLIVLGGRIDEITTELPQCVTWKKTFSYPYSLILSGRHLIAGGDQEIAIVDPIQGDIVSRHPVQGVAYGLAVASSTLFISTDQGSIHAFR